MIRTKSDALLHTSIGSHEPGVAVALLKENSIVHCQGYGLANLEWEQPVTPHTVFGLGSLTKPFTATAIMLLEKQGKLGLDHPIQQYLPDYPTLSPYRDARHLLTHTSGIPNFVTQPEFWDKHAHVKNSADEIIALFKDLPFDFVPGTRYSYSNSGYVLLGHILEKLLDMSYAEVIQQLIFDPLGMTHSYYLSPEPIILFRASGYTHTEQGYQHARFLTAAAKHAAGGLGIDPGRSAPLGCCTPRGASARSSDTASDVYTSPTGNWRHRELWSWMGNWALPSSPFYLPCRRSSRLLKLFWALS